MQAASDLVVEKFRPHGAELPFVFDTITRADTHPHTTPGRTTALLTDKVTEASDPAGDERRLWDGIR